MQIGDRVKHSEYAIRPKRDNYHAQGEYSRKQSAKRYLETYEAERGTLIEFLPADSSRGVAAGLRVRWDNGSESKCLPYMVEVDEK